MSERRWFVLVAVSVAQLMVVLDATITNVALPSAQGELSFGTNARQWVITAYALAFGSLLLPGGRLGDLLGRKRAFVGGLVGLAAASAVGGAATSFAVLVGARAAQGVFAAVLARSALALLTTTFTDPAERGRAFGVFGAVASAGGAIGVLLGGVLTQWLSWRWCLYVNLLFAVPVAPAGVRLLADDTATQRRPLDIAGTVGATSGLFAIVYGLASSESRGWSDPRTIAPLVAAAVLIAGFVAIEQRVAHPLLPLRVVADRKRGGALLAVWVACSAIFAVFLFLSYFLQRNKGFSPLESGLAFLPMPLTIMLSAQAINGVLAGRFGSGRVMVFGMAAGVVAMLWFTRLTPASGYLAGVLPGLVVLGVAMASIMAPAFATATAGVAPSDAGVASAMVNTMQQVGGSVGTALLSSVFASAVSSHLATGPATPQALNAATVHGYTVAFWVTAGVFAAGALTVSALMRPSAPRSSPPVTEPESENVVV